MSLGCANTTGRPCAPLLGCASSRRMRAPTWATAAWMSGTSRQMWWLRGAERASRGEPGAAQQHKKRRQQQQQQRNSWAASVLPAAAQSAVPGQRQRTCRRRGSSAGTWRWETPPPAAPAAPAWCWPAPQTRSARRAPAAPAARSPAARRRPGTVGAAGAWAAWECAPPCLCSTSFPRTRAHLDPQHVLVLGCSRRHVWHRNGHVVQPAHAWRRRRRRSGSGSRPVPHRLRITGWGAASPAHLWPILGATRHRIAAPRKLWCSARSPPAQPLPCPPYWMLPASIRAMQVRSETRRHSEQGCKPSPPPSAGRRRKGCTWPLICNWVPPR